jgi:hypothetical protein
LGRRWSRTRALGLATALLIASAAAAQSPGLVLRAQRWLAPQGDVVASLTREPGECLALPLDARTKLSVEIGRAAFRSPLTLGGQAARAGLTCETCHRSGRANPDFEFPGVSGPPGTADVTSSLFSSHRGDGVFNPKPIPDLAAPKTQLKVAQSGPELETFIHGLVTQEFDGIEPPASVLKGLTDYVRALSPQACLADPDQAVGVANLLSDADRALASAQALSAHGDSGAAVSLVAAARARLYLIDERYTAPGLARDRRALRAFDGELARLAEGLRTAQPRAGVDLTKARRGLSRLAPRLSRQAQRSLFNPTLLHAAMDGRLPRPPS